MLILLLTPVSSFDPSRARPACLAPTRKPHPVSALLPLKMQAKGFSRGRFVSPYRGRARLRVIAWAGDGKQRQVLMGFPWSPVQAEDIAAAAVAARKAFLGGAPLGGDRGRQMQVLQTAALQLSEGCQPRLNRTPQSSPPPLR